MICSGLLGRLQASRKGSLLPDVTDHDDNGMPADAQHIAQTDSAYGELVTAKGQTATVVLGRVLSEDALDGPGLVRAKQIKNFLPSVRVEILN